MTAPSPRKEDDVQKMSSQKAGIDTQADASCVSGHSALPWSFCGEQRGGCSCCTIFEGTGTHPVAEVVHGKWGDDYPSLRIVGGSLDAKVEAYNEQITYGEVALETAKANAALIVRAVNSHDALVKALEQARTMLSNYAAYDEKHGLEEDAGYTRRRIVEIDAALAGAK